MKIEVISRSPEEVENCDYRDALGIKINGKREFSVWDGEPEDSNLSRNFSAIYHIPSLLKMAFEAGKNGETFEIENVESDEI